MSVEGCGALPEKTEEIGRSLKKHLGHDNTVVGPIRGSRYGNTRIRYASFTIHYSLVP